MDVERRKKTGMMFTLSSTMMEVGVSENGGKTPPKSSQFFFGISMDLIIHSGVPLFLETPKWKKLAHMKGKLLVEGTIFH